MTDNRQSLGLITAGALLIWLAVWLYNGGRTDMSVVTDALLIILSGVYLGIKVRQSQAAATLGSHIRERSPLGKSLQVMVVVMFLYAALLLTSVILAFHWPWPFALEVALAPVTVFMELETFIQ